MQQTVQPIESVTNFQSNASLTNIMNNNLTTEPSSRWREKKKCNVNGKMEWKIALKLCAFFTFVAYQIRWCMFCIYSIRSFAYSEPRQERINKTECNECGEKKIIDKSHWQAHRLGKFKIFCVILLLQETKAHLPEMKHKDKLIFIWNSMWQLK